MSITKTCFVPNVDWRSAKRLLLVATLAAGSPLSLSAAEFPSVIKDRTEIQGESCICNEDYTSCLCCETVLTPPFVACDLVLDGEEVTGPASTIVDLTTDGKGGVTVKEIRIRKDYK